MLTAIFQRFVLILGLSGFFVQALSAQPSKREFRGVWVATVANIDWPSEPGLSTHEQQEEILDIVDLHKENGINATGRHNSDFFFVYQPTIGLGGTAICYQNHDIVI